MSFYRRLLVAILGLGLGVALLVALHYLLPEQSRISKLLIARDGASYPFSEQSAMWLLFFLGLAELSQRYGHSRAETAYFKMKLLPEDARSMLQADGLSEAYREVSSLGGSETYFLPRLINRIILQFQSSGSIDQASSLMNSSLDLFLHEVELSYNLLRYITWVIPTIGFIGTVRGISLALDEVGRSSVGDLDLLPRVTSDLAVAFDTTFLALVLSMILVFFMTIIQEKEEGALNRAGQYCVDNLINRLYEK